MKKIKKKYLGFSLVELIIVITILAILGIIAFLSFQSHTGKARDANRISSIGIIKKGLELQFLKTGNYPIPDNVDGVGMINGEIVNMVGTVGANISQMVNLTKIPTDPSSDVEYMYGISENKKKFQIGATLESLQSNLMFPVSYADMFTAKVEGNYEYPLNFKGKLLSLPSLLFVGPSNLVNNSTGFIINGGTNLPYSPTPDYVNTQTTPEVLEEITGVPGLEVKAVDFTEFTSSNELKSTDGGEVDSKLQELGITKEQAGDALFGEKYTDTTNIVIDWSKQAETTAYSCIGDLVIANSIVSNDVMLGANANYQTADSMAPCYYTCKENYTGNNCETFTPPPSTCDTPQPNCYFAGGCDIVEGTPTTQNQVWTKGSPNCGFTCKTNFSGDSCENYTPPACSVEPACYAGGGCSITTGTPTQANQVWTKGSPNCGFTCKTNFSGNSCETYTPPANTCATNPTCYTNGTCILTIGTPSSPNQAWSSGASNCGFACKPYYSGSNCETYNPPVCATNPACSPTGCTLSTGNPTTPNQAWIKGSPNCGFTCKTGYSGNNCETLILPTCATNPTCAGVGCTLTTGTPTQSNQAWTKGGSNCGFVCNAGYSGTYCETFTAPSCATNPTCSPLGCTLTIGSPTTQNQAWTKGSPNCGFICKSGYSGTYCETFNPADQNWKDIAGTNSDNDDIVFVDNGTTYRWAGSNSVLGTTGISTNGGAYNGKCYSYSASYGGTACFGDTTKENAYDANGQNNIWGKLYTWTEANKANNACPTGWRLPTQDEFMKLEKYLTCSNYTTKDTWRCAGLGWQGSSSKSSSNNLVKALKLPLSGHRTTAGFLDRGASAYLWTSTQYTSTTAHGRYLNYANNGVSHGGYSMTQFGLSVRCIKATITGPVNGIAGEDNGKTLASTPTNLCVEGTASAVSGSGPWSWTCSGINGGSSVSGSASKVAGWNSIDPNCYIGDIVIGTQTWAGCNSTKGNGMIYNGGMCRDYVNLAGGSSSIKTCYGYNNKENSYNSTYGQNTIWGKLYKWSVISTECKNPTGGNFSRSTNSTTNCPCPIGRHIPTKNDFKELEIYLNGGTSCLNTIVNSKGCEGLGWKNNSSKNSTNNMVQALKWPLAGNRSSLDSKFNFRGNISILWSSNIGTSSSWASGIYIRNQDNFISLSQRNINNASSVRCIKD